MPMKFICAYVYTLTLNDEWLRGKTKPPIDKISFLYISPGQRRVTLPFYNCLMIFNCEQRNRIPINLQPVNFMTTCYGEIIGLTNILHPDVN